MLQKKKNKAEEKQRTSLRKKKRFPRDRQVQIVVVPWNVLQMWRIQIEPYYTNNTGKKRVRDTFLGGLIRVKSLVNISLVLLRATVQTHACEPMYHGNEHFECFTLIFWL